MKRESALTPQSDWRCPIDGEPMVHLHAFVNDGDIVERIVCACGHVRERTIGRVMHESQFGAIERRLGAIALEETHNRKWKPKRYERRIA